MKTESKTKLVYKGILLYTTIIAVILLVCGADSLYDNGCFTGCFIIVAGMIYTCYKCISEEECSTLLFRKHSDVPEEDEWD